MTTATLQANPQFRVLASNDQITRAAALERNGFSVVVVDTADEARSAVLDLIPPGAEVFTGSSRTLETTGIAQAINTSGDYDSVRTKLGALDRVKDGERMRKLGASPNYIVGSVHAVTEHGEVLVASASGSQLGPYASGAGKVVWVVGAQKIAASLDEGFQRIREYSLPLEDARARQVYGMPSVVAKVLLVNRELFPGRTTIVLVKEELGF